MAKTLLLGFGGIDRGILNISACLPFTNLLGSKDLMGILLNGFLLNCTEMHCLKEFLSLLATSLSQPDS